MAQNAHVENPWASLPFAPPYVLSDDRPLVDAANQSAEPKHFIHCELLPEPFLGSRHASVVLLSLNPGYNPKDILFHRDRSDFIETARANLSHGALRHPFYILDPAFEAASAHAWWEPKLRHLVDAVGLPAVTHGIACVEFFPYHSAMYRWAGDLLPSQAYGFELVRDALRRNALILGMRSRSWWEWVLPELRDSPNVHWLKNPQNVVVSPGNCPPGCYPHLVSVLQKQSGPAA